MRLDGEGKLWIKNPSTEVSLFVPPMYQREGIIKEALK